MSLPKNIISVAVLMIMGGTATAANKLAIINRASVQIKSNIAATRTSANDSFVARSTIVDADGTEHVRFDRSFKGLPVIGGDMVVHSKAGRFKSASLTLAKPLNLSVVPKLKSADALVIAGSDFGTGFEGLPTTRLVVFARAAVPKLAYETLYTGVRADRTPTRMHYFVDANSGKILAKWDAIETGKVPNVGNPEPAPATGGTGRSLLSGTVPLNTVYGNRKLYELKDATRGGIYTVDYGNTFRDETAVKFLDGDNVWGNSTRSDRATIAVDAQYGVTKTWDFYKNVFGRVGVRNDGVGTMNAVHFQSKYMNAFWSDDCFCMVFGDGDGVNYNPFVMIDVTGHEMTHGVTSHTSALEYYGASGGLNEATSDIMGAMVEFYTNNGNNPPNYLIGEKIFVDNPGNLSALRYMFKPSLDGISPDCYPERDENPDGYEFFFNNYMDVHFNSGVANHFYYLLAEGVQVPGGYGLTPDDLVCNGNTALQGIGRSAAQQIWYRALVLYMTSNSNYDDARAATLSAATDLYGANSAQRNAVAAAWAAVNLN